MAKRLPDNQGRYDPVSQKFLTALSQPRPAQETPPAPHALPGASHAPSPPAPLPTKRDREKRMLLTPAEDHEVERQVARLAAELATPLKLSHVLRAFLHLLRCSEPDLLARARDRGPLSRPPNGDPEALLRFEEQVAELLASALRDIPASRFRRNRDHASSRSRDNA